MPPLFPLTLALYAVACTLCYVGVAQPTLLGARRAALPVLVLGFLSQAVDIAWLCIHGLHPVSSSREALFFASWLMVGALPVLTFRQPQPLLGALLLPVAMVMQVVVRVAPAVHSSQAMAAGKTWLGTAHVLTATIGIALFGVAAATGMVYLVIERRLKRFRTLPQGPLATRGPSLETLDAWHQQSIGLGFLCFTVALVTGTYWLMLSTKVAAGAGLFDHVQELFGQSRYTLAVGTWLLYVGLLCGRFVWGLRGRRAAWATLVGFGAALGVLLVYLWRDLR